MNVLVFVLMGFALAVAYPITMLTPEEVVECHAERYRRLQPKQPYDMADEILPGLWLGSVCAARDPAFLEKHNISIALSMASEWAFEGEHHVTDFYHVPGLGDSIDEDFDDAKFAIGLGVRAVRLMRRWRPSQVVLVFCNMGVSRSASVVMAYLIKEGLNVSLVQEKRPVVQPNALYQKVLEAFTAWKEEEEL